MAKPYAFPYGALVTSEFHPGMVFKIYSPSERSGNYYLEGYNAPARVLCSRRTYGIIEVRRERIRRYDPQHRE